MSLDLDKSVIYADPYDTNWNYLHNMTALQMKALEGIEWNKASKHIRAGLLSVPWAWYNKKTIKDSVKYFIDNLNDEIMVL